MQGFTDGLFLTQPGLHREGTLVACGFGNFLSLVEKRTSKSEYVISLGNIQNEDDEKVVYLDMCPACLAAKINSGTFFCHKLLS